MSLRHAVVFSVLIAILLPYYYFVDRAQRAPHDLGPMHQSVLDFDTVKSFTIGRGFESVRCDLDGGGKYKVVEPPGRFIPQDLIQAMAEDLTEMKTAEVVSSHTEDFAQFGLDRPSMAVVVVSGKSPQPIAILIGADNPSGTAVYARVAGLPQVFLLGKTIEYYQSLMFQWIEGKQGKHA